MKKNIFLSLFIALAIFGGLILSSCETETYEGTGTIKLINNSSNMRIVYWSAEKGGKTVGENRVSVSYGGSVSAIVNSGSGYRIYLEDNYADGWLSKSLTVKKDQTVEVKFPGDFSVSN